MNPTRRISEADLLAAREELEQYIGIPMCQDCKWKLGTDITNNCHCRGAAADPAKYAAAFSRARELQYIVPHSFLFGVDIPKDGQE